MRLVEFNNVTVGYGWKTILSNLSFSVNSGDVVFIKGGNGSGKTTLLRALVQNENVRISGDVSYWLPSSTKDFTQVLRREIAFGEQNDDFGDSSIGDYLAFPFREGIYKCEYGSSDKDIIRYIVDYMTDNRLTECFEEENIRKLLKRKMRSLSGGQQHLLSIYAELIRMEGHAKLYIFDEPLNHLDTSNSIAVLNKINALHRADPECAIIVCSHCMSITCVNKCYRINKGILTPADDSFYRCNGCFGEVDSDGFYFVE